MPRISIVAPFFNEEIVLEESVKRMINNLERDFDSDWELILIDDGSTDDSLQTVEKVVLKEGFGKNIRVVGFTFNQGRGKALKAGIDSANSPIIITTEIDCSWGNDVIHRLAQILASDSKVDFVIASPHLAGGTFKNVPLHRVLLSKIGNYLIRLFFGSGATMNTGMTRGYRANVIKPLRLYEMGKEFHLEVLLKLLTVGFCFVEIPATLAWQKQGAGRSAGKRKSSTKLFRTIFTHLKFVIIAQPVRYFGFLAFIFFIFSIFFLSVAIYQLFLGTEPASYYAIVGLISGVFTMILTGFSILFMQFRELMKENWTLHYGNNIPPYSKDPHEIEFPLDKGN